VLLQSVTTLTRPCVCHSTQQPNNIILRDAHIIIASSTVQHITVQHIAVQHHNSNTTCNVEFYILSSAIIQLTECPPLFAFLFLLFLHQVERMVWCHTLLQHPRMAWVEVAYHGIWSEFYLLSNDRGVTTAGFVIPRVQQMSLHERRVAVAVRAIMLTVGGIRLLTSPTPF